MWTSSLGLRVPSSWWPGQWERGRWGPQTSGVFALQTGDPRGPLLPWQEVGKASQGKDFIGLGLQDGHLVFRWVLSLHWPPYPLTGFPSGQPMAPAARSYSSQCPSDTPLPPSQTPSCPAPPHTFLGLCDCSYQLGSGEARLVSEDPINDGEWHRVTALR